LRESGYKAETFREAVSPGARQDPEGLHGVRGPRDPGGREDRDHPERGLPPGWSTRWSATLDVSKNDIFRVLRTPESTAHKLIKDNRPLDTAASERVVRVADITRMAEETFGGREPATQWLKTPNLALDRATPLSMLDTELGAGEVRRILSAINYGGAF